MATRNRFINPNAIALAEILSDEEIANFLEQARQKECDKQEAARQKERNERNAVYREQIAQLLRVADNSLREAGKIARDHQISFQFVSPKGNYEVFNNWNESACYAGDGWYYDYNAHSSVEGVPVDNESSSWYSSSDNNC